MAADGCRARHRTAESCHDPRRVILAGEELQDHRQPERLVEVERLVDVQRPANGGIAGDLLGLAQVRSGRGGRGVVSQQRAGADVDDLRARSGRCRRRPLARRGDALGDLVDVGLGGDASADVEEPPDAGLASKARKRTARPRKLRSSLAAPAASDTAARSSSVAARSAGKLALPPNTPSRSAPGWACWCRCRPGHPRGSGSRRWCGSSRHDVRVIGPPSG